MMVDISHVSAGVMREVLDQTLSPGMWNYLIKIFAATLVPDSDLFFYQVMLLLNYW